MSDLIMKIEAQQKAENPPVFRVGDTVKVHFKIVEGKTERIQVYEGLVICFKIRNRKNIYRTKNSYGVGLNEFSPFIHLELLRLKLYAPERYAGLNFTISGIR